MEPAKVLGLLGGKGGYGKFVREGLGEGHKEEYYEVEDQRFLGTEGFGEAMEGRAAPESNPKKRKSLEAAVRQLAEKLDIGVPLLRGPDRSWAVSRARTIVAYVLTRRLGYRLGEVAGYLRRDPATVSTLGTRLFDRLRSDAELHRRLERLSRIVES